MCNIIQVTVTRSYVLGETGQGQTSTRRLTVMKKYELKTSQVASKWSSDLVAVMEYQSSVAIPRLRKERIVSDL